MNFSNNSWLSIKWRIRFKLATLTFKALHTGRPPYLSDLLQHHEPTRSLCSSSSHQLSVPRHNLTFGSRAFRYSASRVWNSLSVSAVKNARTTRRSSACRAPQSVETVARPSIGVSSTPLHRDCSVACFV